MDDDNSNDDDDDDRSYVPDENEEDDTDEESTDSASNSDDSEPEEETEYEIEDDNEPTPDEVTNTMNTKRVQFAPDQPNEVEEITKETNVASSEGPIPDDITSNGDSPEQVKFTLHDQYEPSEVKSDIL